jgi:ribosomal protein L29
MKKKELTDIRHKSTEELTKRLEELRKKRVDFEIKISAGRSQDIGQLKELKRDIAQILTILHEQEKKTNKSQKTKEI